MIKELLNPAEEFDNKEALILRDHLALERTRLANERTLFSYLRTSLYLLTAGVGIFEIESISHLKFIGWLCIVSGLLLLILGFIRFCKTRKHLSGFSARDSWQ